MSKGVVLIVEDDPTVKFICEHTLREHGFETLTAENGVEGLRAYRENSASIKLVLADIAMPQMDGIRMLRKIFKINPRCCAIVIAASHLGDLPPKDVLHLCSAMQKPFTPDALIAAVESCLDGAK